MTERKKLINLICEGMADRCGAECKIPNKQYCNQCFDIADYLLANNVNFVEKGRNFTENHPVDEFVCSECEFICEDWTEVVYDEDANDRNNREFEFRYCPKCGCKLEDFWKDERDKK